MKKAEMKELAAKLCHLDLPCLAKGTDKAKYVEGRLEYLQNDGLPATEFALEALKELVKLLSEKRRLPTGSRCGRPRKGQKTFLCPHCDRLHVSATYCPNRPVNCACGSPKARLAKKCMKCAGKDRRKPCSERNSQIIEMVVAGNTYDAAATKFGITRARVGQIVKKYGEEA